MGSHYLIVTRKVLWANKKARAILNRTTLAESPEGCTPALVDKFWWTPLAAAVTTVSGLWG